MFFCSKSRVEKESKNKILSTYSRTDKIQTQSTKNLQNRAHLIDIWKQTLERAIQALVDETSTMEEQRRRLKQALLVLQLPESIGKKESGQSYKIQNKISSILLKPLNVWSEDAAVQTLSLSVMSLRKNSSKK
jgi:hypothetical protein